MWLKEQFCTLFKTFPCPGLHSTIFYIIWKMGYNSILKCIICCLSNTKRPIKPGGSFLVLEMQGNKLSFTLEWISQDAQSIGPLETFSVC